MAGSGSEPRSGPVPAVGLPRPAPPLLQSRPSTNLSFQIGRVENEVG